MNTGQHLPLEQQFELKVFERQVEQLSLQEAQALLVKLKESMLFQTTSFRTILQETWDIDQDIDLVDVLLSEG